MCQKQNLHNGPKRHKTAIRLLDYLEIVIPEQRRQLPKDRLQIEKQVKIC